MAVPKSETRDPGFKEREITRDGEEEKLSMVKQSIQPAKKINIEKESRPLLKRWNRKTKEKTKGFCSGGARPYFSWTSRLKGRT